MNNAIKLNSEIDDSDVAAIAVLGEKFVTMFDNRNGEVKLQRMPDFGTVLIGFNSREEIEAESLMPLFVGETDTVWFAPSDWKMGHIAKRFGMFPSVSQASKNGFGSEIPVGFSQVQLRVNKLRGILTFFKKA